MIASLAYIFLLGLAFAAVCAKLKLPVLSVCLRQE